MRDIFRFNGREAAVWADLGAETPEPEVTQSSIVGSALTDRTEPNFGRTSGQIGSP